jgi:hypothetical protein
MCKLIDQIDVRVKARYHNFFKTQLQWCRVAPGVSNITITTSKYRVTVSVTWRDHIGDRCFAFSCPGNFTDLTSTEHTLQPGDI